MIVRTIQTLAHTIDRWRRACLLAAPMSAAACALAAGVPTLRIAYLDWSSSVASANVVCAVLRERLGHPCELTETTADAMWRMVADGKADALLSAWLPDTHAAYLAEYGDRLVDLGPNLVGTRTGLVIPAGSVGRQTDSLGERNRPTLDIDSIPQLADHREALGAGSSVSIQRQATCPRPSARSMLTISKASDWSMAQRRR